MKQKTFHEMITQLEKIVEQLESGDCTLEQSMELFEQGTTLAKLCNRKLSTAEQKITELSSIESVAERGEGEE